MNWRSRPEPSLRYETSQPQQRMSYMQNHDSGTRHGARALSSGAPAEILAHSQELVSNRWVSLAELIAPHDAVETTRWTVSCSADLDTVNRRLENLLSKGGPSLVPTCLLSPYPFNALEEP